MTIMVQNCAGDGKTTFPTLFLCYVFHILYCAKSFLCFKFLRDRGSDFYKGTEQVDGDIFTFFFLHRREDRSVYLYCEQKAQGLRQGVLASSIHWWAGVQRAPVGESSTIPIGMHEPVASSVPRQLWCSSARHRHQVCVSSTEC